MVPTGARPDVVTLTELADRLCHHVWEELASFGVNSKDVEKIVRHMAVVLVELGRTAFLFAISNGIIAQVEGRIENYSCLEETKDSAEVLKAQMENLQLGLASAYTAIASDDELTAKVPLKSHKVEALLDLLARILDKNASNPMYCGMVFVEEVSLAIPLAWLLQQHLQEFFQHPPSSAANVFREAMCRTVAATGTQNMKEVIRNAAFDAFEKGHSRVMVCTNCAEEGVDVAACAFVVRYSGFHTTKSHKQGSGRARQPEAEVFYFENDAEVCKSHVIEAS